MGSVAIHLICHMCSLNKIWCIGLFSVISQNKFFLLNFKYWPRGIKTFSKLQIYSAQEKAVCVEYLFNEAARGGEGRGCVLSPLLCSLFTYIHTALPGRAPILLLMMTPSEASSQTVMNAQYPIQPHLASSWAPHLTQCCSGKPWIRGMYLLLRTQIRPQHSWFPHFHTLYILDICNYTFFYIYLLLCLKIIIMPTTVTLCISQITQWFD